MTINTRSANEINADVVSVTTTEGNFRRGMSDIITQVDDNQQAIENFTIGDLTDNTAGVTIADLNILQGASVAGLTAAELRLVGALNATTARLDWINGVDGDLNVNDLNEITGLADAGVTAATSPTDVIEVGNVGDTTINFEAIKGWGGTVNDLHRLSAISATAPEINILAGVTGVNSTEIGYLGSVTSDIQMQLNGKQPIDTELTELATMGSTTAAALADLSQAEVQILDGATVSTTELNLLDGVTSTTAELNILDGVTATAAEINKLDGATVTTAQLNYLTASGLVIGDFTKLASIDASATELNIMDGVTATTAELNVMDGVTATTGEINLLDGVTSTTAELNILDGVTATATELNKLDGATATTAELNFVDGVTSSIQTQINGKANLAGPVFTGNPTAPTQAVNNSTTRLATTAFVQQELGHLVVIEAESAGDPVVGDFTNGALFVVQY